MRGRALGDLRGLQEQDLAVEVLVAGLILRRTTAAAP